MTAVLLPPSFFLSGSPSHPGEKIGSSATYFFFSVGDPVAKRTQKCSKGEQKGQLRRGGELSVVLCLLFFPVSLCERSVLRRLQCRAPSERGMIYGALFITGRGHFSGTQLAGTTPCGSCTLRLPPLPPSSSPSLSETGCLVRCGFLSLPFFFFSFFVLCFACI